MRRFVICQTLTLVAGQKPSAKHQQKLYGALLFHLKIALNPMQDTPNFAAWTNENLAKFALEAYLRLQAQQDAIEQLRGDLKDAMQLVRASTLTVDD
jgi:hypothetical protein